MKAFSTRMIPNSSPCQLRTTNKRMVYHREFIQLIKLNSSQFKDQWVQVLKFKVQELILLSLQVQESSFLLI